MPRILLIKTPVESDAVSPPLGLGYLAASARHLGRVILADGVRLRLSPRNVAALAHRMKPDVIGFSVVSAGAGQAAACIQAVRKACPTSLVVAGGPHPTALPDSFQSQAGPGLDCILRGEAEQSLPQLVRALGSTRPRDAEPEVLAAIPGIHALTARGLVASPPAIHKDFGFSGMPAWDLMPPSSYPKAPHGAFFRAFPVAPVLTSRGCPHCCGFCGVPSLSGRHIRFRDPELVAQEVSFLSGRFGVREFQVIDDNFTADRKHALAVCEALLKIGPVLPWSCPNGVRIDNLDDTLITAMKAAGCYSVSLGLESGCQEVLVRMNKHLDMESAANAAHRLARHGIEVNGFFILGYPGETPRQASQTIAFAKSLPLTRANFSLFTPIPGSTEFGRLMREGPRPPVFESTFARGGWVPSPWSARGLKKAQRRAFLEFYARPVQARKLFRAVRSPSQILYTAQRAWRWLART